MQTILLGIMILVSILYSENDITILNEEEDSDVADILIRGNGEECKVSIDSIGTLVGTSCLQITNSKGIKILCTAKKKMCKTISEVQNVVNPHLSPKANSPTPTLTSLNDLRQGMKYSEARQIIMNLGYQAIPTRWQDIPEYGQDNDIYYNNGWREVVSCAGTGNALCRFEFQDINQKKLVVITQGECLTINFELPKKGEKCDVTVNQWFYESSSKPIEAFEEKEQVEKSYDTYTSESNNVNTQESELTLEEEKTSMSNTEVLYMSLFLLILALSVSALRKTIGLLFVIFGAFFSFSGVGFIFGVPMMIVGGIFLFI